MTNTHRAIFPFSLNGPLQSAGRLGLLLALVATSACKKRSDDAPFEDSERTLSSGDGAEYLAQEIVVRRSATADEAAFEAAISALGGRVVEPNSQLTRTLGYYRVALPEEVIADQVISDLNAGGLADSAERNYIVTLDEAPDDPRYSESWGLERIAADRAWAIETGSATVVVAVTDSGIDRAHPDLASNIWTNPAEVPGNNLDDDGNGFIDDVHGWDWANNDNNPDDDKGHGTHCAGIIGAVGNNGIGTAGVNWRVRLMPLKFMTADGRGTLWDATQALLYAANNGADVVNASWGCRGCYTEYFHNAVKTLAARGVLLVAAAGNDSANLDDTPYYPAAFSGDNVISVAATVPTDALASFSNFGPTKVHIAAPGSLILSTLPGGVFGNANGTSMAAPFVAGAAALFLAAYPDATYDTVRARILQTSDSVGALQGKVATAGRLNVYRMLTDDAEAPPAPAMFTAAAGSRNDALLSWAPVDADDLAMYRVRWGSGAGLFADSADVPRETTETVIEDLPNGVRTYFVVHAVDRNGNVSQPSEERSVIPGDVTPPAQVIDLTASPPSKVRASGAVFAASSEASLYYRAENAYDGSESTAWISMPRSGDGLPGVASADTDKETGKDDNCGYNKDKGENCGKRPDKGAGDGDDTDGQATDRGADTDSDTGDGTVEWPDDSDGPDSDDSAPNSDDGQGGGDAPHDPDKRSQSVLEYLIVDFDAPHTIDRVVLTPIAAFPEFFPVDYDIEVSQDGSNWLLVGGGRNASVGPFDTVEVRFPAVYAAAVRMTVRTAHQHESGLYYAGIAEMAAYKVDEQPGQIKLRFTAPGDDPGSGKAARYDIRRSQTLITESSFVQAVPIPSPRTGLAGVIEEVLVEGLAPETVYWFAMTAVDEAGNTSPMSNVAVSGTAAVPPGTVMDLEALSVHETEVTLTWTAPGGDGYAGRAAAYDLRVSDAPITAANFVYAETATVPRPSPAENREYVTVTGLGPNRYHHFALRAVDEHGHAGGISNAVTVKTEAPDADIVPPATVRDMAVFESTERTAIEPVNIDSSTHYNTSYNAHRMLDGDPATMWLSEEAPGDKAEWAVFDLGYPRPVSHFRMHPPIFGTWLESYPQDFQIQASADGYNYENLVDVQGLTPRLGAWNEWSAPITYARFIRLYITKRGVASCESPEACTLPSRVAISEIEFYGPTAEFDVDLVWVAPGDDQWLGRAYAYDLQHHRAPFSQETFDQGEQITIAPPDHGGMLQMVTVGDLDWGADHYFAFKTVDESGNWSGMSNVVHIGAPPVPPAPISDLAITDVTRDSVTLFWTAVGDDGYEGRATAYDLRYARVPVTSDTWSEAESIIDPPAPALSGASESLTVYGLAGETRYFFAMKVLDDEGAASLLSNMALADTLDEVPPVDILDLVVETVDPRDAPPVTLTVTDSSGAFVDSARAELLVDGDHRSSWLSPKRQQLENDFVVFESEAVEQIGSIRMLAAPGYEDMFPVGFAVHMRQYPDAAWTTVVRESAFRTEGEWEEWSIGAVAAKEIKLEITDANRSNGGMFAALAELELYADPTRFDAVALSWTAPGGSADQGRAAAYDIRWDTAPITSLEFFHSATTVPGAPLPQNPGMPERLEVSGLEPETEHCFAIVTEDSARNRSGLSNSACGYTHGVPPATTIDLELLGTTTRTATVRWTAPGDDRHEGRAARYQIKVAKERMNRINWDHAPIHATPPLPRHAGGEETFTIEGLEGDTHYYIALRTFDEGGNASGISNNVQTTTLDDVPPSETLDLWAETDFSEWGRLFVSWTAPGDSGLVGQAAAYDLRISETEITAETFDSSRPVPTPTPSPAGAIEQVFIESLDPEKRYFVALVSVDEGGNRSPMSNVAAARTRDEAPAAVTDLALVETTGHVLDDATWTIQWTAPGDDDIYGVAHRYDIRYSESPINEGNFNRAVPAQVDLYPSMAGTLEHVTISGLGVGVRYYVALKTIDERDNVSAISNMVEGGTEDRVPPGPVLDLKAATGKKRGTVALSWTHVGDDGYTGQAYAYELRYAAAPIDASNFDDAVRVSSYPEGGISGESARFTAAGLPDEAGLHFALKAIDDSGNHSEVSNDAPARTLDVPPARIADLAQSRTALTAVDVSWTATGDNDRKGTAAAYDLRYSPSPIDDHNFASAPRAATPPPRTSGAAESATITGLQPASNYYVAIKAVDDRGNWSPLSNTQRVTTLDTIPPGQIDPLTAETGIAKGTIQLLWQATGDDGDAGRADHYILKRSLDVITPDTWHAAEEVRGLPTPKSAGANETFTVQDLTGETRYHFAIQAVDEAGNKGPISNDAAAETPPIPPAAVKDLRGEPKRPRSVVLRWTAPGDDGNVGTAVRYDIRYAKKMISKASFDAATPVPTSPVPRAAGGPESVVVAGLSESTPYYFALKTVDDRDAISELSNVAEVITLDETPPGAPLALTVRPMTYATSRRTPIAAEASTILADILGPENTIHHDDLGDSWVSEGKSAPSEEWLQVDLGAAFEVDRLRLLPSGEYRHLFPQNITVSASLDEESWLDILTVEDFEPPSDAWMTFGFDQQWARYLRIAAYDPLLSYFGLYYTVISGVDLYSALPLDGRASLSWSAPGDDEYQGSADYYQVFYGAEPFDAAGLDRTYRFETCRRSQSDACSGPRPAGAADGLSRGGLPGERLLYFAVRAVDEAGNIGALSEVVSGMSGDGRPAIVRDLTVTGAGKYAVTLSWSAAGDDGILGAAARHELRYATWPMTLETFQFATEASGVPAPLAPGTGHSHTVTGLHAGTAYYFAVVTEDEKGNASYLSNLAVGRTQPEPDHTAPSPVTDLSVSLITERSASLIGTATGCSSAQPPEHTAQAVTDGSQDTMWASAAKSSSSEEWVEIDLGAVSPVDEIRAWPARPFADLFPSDIEIQVSPDRLDWLTVTAKQGYVADPDEPLEAAFPVAPVRFVKLIAHASKPGENGFFYTVVSEIEAHHAASPPGALLARWTARGDDGDKGQATEYDLRISGCPFDPAGAAIYPTDPPRPAGAPETSRIAGLSEGTYCIGVAVIDEAGNQSAWSNIAEIFTPGSSSN